MLEGRIKHLEGSKGWGFIETEDGEDYFFNVSNVSHEKQHIIVYKLVVQMNL